MNCTGQVNGRPVEISDDQDNLTFSYTDKEEGYYYSIHGGYRALRDYWEIESGTPEMNDDGYVIMCFDEQAVAEMVKRNAPEYIEEHYHEAKKIEA